MPICTDTIPSSNTFTTTSQKAANASGADDEEEFTLDPADRTGGRDPGRGRVRQARHAGRDRAYNMGRNLYIEDASRIKRRFITRKIKEKNAFPVFQP